MGPNEIRYDKYVFDQDKIDSGEVHLAASLDNSSLEANTLTAVVECEDKSIADFTRNAPLVYRYRGKQRGIFYIQTIDRIGPTLYQLYATSAMGLLSEGQHYGGIYNGETAEQVIADICGDIPFLIKNNLRGIKLYGWLPVASPRDNLARVLFAIGAAVKTDLDGVLRIESYWDGASGYVDSDRIYRDDPRVIYDGKVTQVVVTEHQYVEGGDETKLFDGTAQAGDIITFSEPMYSLQADGFTILESNANYALLSAGSGTLTGRAYIHNTRQVSRDVEPSDQPNIKTIEDATLVSLVNSAAVAERMAEYYRCRQTVDVPIAYEGQTPGDVVSVYHPFDREMVPACMETADITLSNILKASSTFLANFRPPQTGDMEYFDTVEVLTQSGDFVVPDNVTLITKVLISGAQGGWSGNVGQQGKQGGTLSFSYSDEAGRYIGWGQGGEGGEGGQGGLGGRILQVTETVTPGQVLHVEIGVGGEGGAPSADGSQPGEDGTDTVCGDDTTADGSVSELGFTDPISGKVYGAPGGQGLSGGKGSSADAEEGEYESNKWIAYTVTGPAGTFTGGGIGPENASTGGNMFAGSGQALGGGPAYGANGADGSKIGRFYAQVNSSTGARTAYARAPAGANGADATLPGFDQDKPGNGGNGGHGGGGGGGEGLAAVWYSNSQSASLTVEHATNQSTGGLGSKGGKGANGVALIYYRIPKATKSGPLVGLARRLILDRLARRIIV